VAIDRAATLKNAEKLISQGKVEPAIAEYLRLLEDQPRDWNLANTLGDLYVRAGQVDTATELFARMADSLNEAGFLPKASAIYKKVLKLRPDHEHALLRAAEIAGRMGLFADARAYLGQLIARRERSGDKPGVAQARIRLGALDPADFAARKDGARARIEVGDVAGAARDFKDIAAAQLDKERGADAAETLVEGARLAPDDEDIRRQLIGIYIAAGDLVRARECASTAAQFKWLAAALEAAGHQDLALDALSEASRLNPDDGELRARLARTYAACGDLKTAARYLTAETAGDDPRLMFTAAEIQLRGERPETGLDILRRLLAQHPDRGEEVAFLGWRLAEQLPDRGFAVVELAAETAVAGQDWASAAAALQEFVTRVPNHLPGLMRLVEICVDGGLDATMYSAQAHLADAYIARGQAGEARFIAEDLVAREPWDRSNLERFRRALELQGERDPEAVIADRLSGRSPFMTTDPFAVAGESEPDNPLDQLELSSNAIDVEGAGFAPAGPTAHASGDSVEVDLSIVLGDGRPPAPDSIGAGAAAVDIDDMFAQMRNQASRRSPLEDAEQHYQRALVFREIGDVDSCVPALEMASRAPRLRFTAASMLARIFRDRGLMPQAVEWFEKAAEAPAPTAEEGYELLYDLADALEKEGESARALAIALELQADAGAYRDVAERIDRLMKAQG
jgi:tetratricopeptide (TPR) repeat protein